MNLAYILHRFPVVSETFILREMRELGRRGDDVVVCSLERPPADDPMHAGASELAARAVYVPGGPGGALPLIGASLAALLAAPGRGLRALAWSLRWAIRDRRLTEVRRFAEAAYLRRRLPRGTAHIHAHYVGAPATVALLLARLTGRPFSFTGHAVDIFLMSRPALLRAKGAEGRFVVAVSDYTAAHLAGLLDPRDRSKVIVVRNGIDREPVAERMAEPEDPPVVLSIGRLIEKKGHDTLIEACAVLAERGRRFRCRVIGDGPLRQRLRSLALGLGIGDRVTLLGSRDQEAVREALRRASVFALPCRIAPGGDRDGLPVALVEAMAAGVPVVTTATSGIPELVRDEESGLIVPPDDPAALAAAIERLLDDERVRARVVRGGRGATEPYDLRACVDRLRGMFLGDAGAA